MRANEGTVPPNKDPVFPDENWPDPENQEKLYILTPRNRYVESERGQGVLTSKNKEDHGLQSGCLARPPLSRFVS